MIPEIMITKYSGGNEKEILGLVRRVFDEYCSSDCDQFGLKVFYDFIEEYNFIERSTSTSVTFIATIDDTVTGIIEMRDNNHICLLFVDKRYQGMGIARKLMNAAHQQAAKHGSKQIDVNASLFSVPIYERLGFRKTDTVKEVNGITFFPMLLEPV